MFALLLAAVMITPDVALQKLVEGNARSASDQLLHPNRTIERREAVVAQQNPFAIIVGCSDSRVPPEIIFDQGLGDLFIVRVAGNVVGPVELDSIEYAAKYLGSSLILVLGHQNCGAVTAVVKGQTAEIEDVAKLIEPALEGKKDMPIDAAVKANVLHVVNYLKTLDSSSCVSYLAKEGKLKVVGGYYDLNSGKITLLSK
jgi:carbonic anhydrase